MNHQSFISTKLGKTRKLAGVLVSVTALCAASPLGAATTGWSAPTRAATAIAPVLNVTCSATVCWASTYRGLLSSTNGETFNSVDSTFAQSVAGIWCDSSSAKCVSVNQIGSTFVSSNSGSTWNTSKSGTVVATTLKSITREFMNLDLECSTGIGCILASPNASRGNRTAPIFFAPWAGTGLGAWILAKNVSGAESQLTCTASGICFVNTSTGATYRSTNGGAAWQLVTNLPLSSWVVAGSTVQTTINCIVGTESCIAFSLQQVFAGLDPSSYRSRIYATNDGGATWVVKSSATGNVISMSIACATTSHCVRSSISLESSTPLTFGATTEASSDFGATWSSSTNGDATRVVCPSTTRCFSFTDLLTGLILSMSNDMDLIGFSTTSDFTTWTSAMPQGTFVVGDVQCVSPTDCYMLEASSLTTISLLRSTDRAATWSLASNIPAAMSLSGDIALSCTSASCVVVGQTKDTTPNQLIEVSTDHGAHWTSVDLGTVTGALHDVACTSVRCVAVGVDGSGKAVILLSTDHGVTWTSVLGSSATSGNLASVSCSTTSSCTAVGSTTGHKVLVGYSADGSTWTTRTGTTKGAFDAVSCTSATSCFASGSNQSMKSISAPLIGGGIGKITTWSTPIDWSGCTGTTCYVGTHTGAKVVVKSSTNFGATFSTSTPSALQLLRNDSLSILPIEVLAPQCSTAAFCIQATSDGRISTRG